MQQLINAISNGNKRAFSQLVGVTPTVIENIVGTRKGKPGYELLEKIAFAIENVNTDWLLTGRGSMLHNSKTSEESTTGDVPNSVPTSPAEESIIYKMYQDLQAEKKEKEAENKELTVKMLQMSEELGSLKAQLASHQHQESAVQGMAFSTEAFTSDSSDNYGKDSLPMRKPTTSAKSSGVKT